MKKYLEYDVFKCASKHREAYRSLIISGMQGVISDLKHKSDTPFVIQSFIEREVASAKKFGDVLLKRFMEDGV
jgi:hypothetical protein